MSPVRLRETATERSIFSQMNRDSSFSSADKSQHKAGNGTCTLQSDAASNAVQLSGFKHNSIGADELSGNFSGDECSLPMSDSNNLVGTLDKLSLSVNEGDDHRWQQDAEEADLPSQSAKIKLCIEKDYFYVINIDHSQLAEELTKRALMMKNNAELNFSEMRTQSGLGQAELRTPTTVARSSAKKMLTGESIRKLLRIMSPATRRHRSMDVHSSGSSISGDTLTGSKSSLAGDSELPSKASHDVCAEPFSKQKESPPPSSA